MVNRTGWYAKSLGLVTQAHDKSEVDYLIANWQEFAGQLRIRKPHNLTPLKTII